MRGRKCIFQSYNRITLNDAEYKDKVLMMRRDEIKKTKDRIKEKGEEVLPMHDRLISTLRNMRWEIRGTSYKGFCSENIQLMKDPRICKSMSVSNKIFSKTLHIQTP